MAALVSDDPTGLWAEQQLQTGQLAAPHLMPVEVAHSLRRAVHAGTLSNDVAAVAHADLLSLDFDLYPYAPFASRVWELVANVTPYDAWYVALAETLGADCATLDVRLTKASGPRCSFVTPP
jgi:predicted nucleic acid-binding protein